MPGGRWRQLSPAPPQSRMVTPQWFATSDGLYCGKMSKGRLVNSPLATHPRRASRRFPPEAGELQPIVTAQTTSQAKRMGGTHPRDANFTPGKNAVAAEGLAVGRGLAKERSGGGQRPSNQRRGPIADMRPSLTAPIAFRISRLFRNSRSGNRNAMRILPNYLLVRFLLNNHTIGDASAGGCVS
jgi:hypothetical protein